MTSDNAADTPIVELLRSVPDDWITYSEKPGDPMAGVMLHGDLLKRAADEIDRLKNEIVEDCRLGASIEAESQTMDD